MPPRLTRACWSALLLTLSACGAGPMPPSTPAPQSVPSPSLAHDTGPTSYGSEIGGLSQEDVEEQLASMQPAFLRCVRASSPAIRFLGGEVGIRMRVAPTGRVRWVYLTESTLGDRNAERCLLDTIRERTWPRPLSGDGLAQTSFEVEPTAPPSSWPRFKAAAIAQRALEATRACRDGVEGSFVATVYVAPQGHVLSAGVAPPDERGEEASDCIAQALTRLRVRNLAVAQHDTAKVSFSLP